MLFLSTWNLCNRFLGLMITYQKPKPLVFSSMATLPPSWFQWNEAVHVPIWIPFKFFFFWEHVLSLAAVKCFPIESCFCTTDPSLWSSRSHRLESTTVSLPHIKVAHASTFIPPNVSQLNSLLSEFWRVCAILYKVMYLITTLYFCE